MEAVESMGEVLTGKALAANAPGKQRPYLRTKNVFDGHIDIRDVLTMPMTDAQFEHFQIVAGDVLLNEGQSLELVGRCAMYMGDYPEPCAMQNQLLRFRPRPGVSAEFASHLFRYCQQTGVFARVALQTTSIAHLGGRRFERLLLPWPDDEQEQNAIAKALSDTDALIGSLDNLIAKKRAIKLAAMQQLLTGKTRLPKFCKDNRHVKTTVGEIPADWCVQTISQVGDVKTGPFGSTLHERDYVPEGTPIITVEHLGEFGILHTEIPMVSNFDRKRLAAYILTTGDIVFSRVGSVDRNGLVGDDEAGWLFSGRLLRIRPHPDLVDGAFLSYQFHNQDFKHRVHSVAVGQTMPSLNTGLLGSVEIVLPSLAEQRAIAAVLSSMDNDIAALERRSEKVQALKRGMMQALLTGRTRLITPKSESQPRRVP